MSNEIFEEKIKHEMENLKLNKEISNQVLTISVSLKGKGGIATVVSSLSTYYDCFNYIASSFSKNPFTILVYFSRCILLLLYYIIFRRIKIVHIHGSFNGSFYRKMILINICKFLKIKIIYHIHSGGFKKFYEKSKHKELIETTIKKVDLLISPTKENMIFFSSFLPQEKNIIINNFIEERKVTKIYKENIDIVSFLFLGMITDHKGIFDLIEVIAENKEILEGKMKLTVGGSGESDRLKQLISLHELDGIVKYIGWIAGKEKDDLMLNSDVFIMPSHIESFGMSNLEAMVYGMPIISTNIGGIPEVVSNNENGILITPKDKNNLFRAINYFIINQKQIGIMGRRSTELAKKFYPKSVIPKLDCIYRSMLQNINLIKTHDK